MLEIVSDRYISLSPYGAYFLVTEETRDPLRRMLLAIAREPTSPLLSNEAVLNWSGGEDLETAIGDLQRLQSMTLLQATPAPLAAPDGALESSLPPLLAPLSAIGKALLADAHGLYLASHGFRHEVSEELAALSADIASLHARHSGLLARNLRLSGSSWGLLDPAGASQLGIWPLHLGKHRFALALAGQPRLNQAAFSQLVWALARRYAAD